MKNFIWILCFFSANSFSQTVYLECVLNDNRQTLAVNFNDKTVTDFVGKQFKAKITDESITWESTFENSSSSDTLNRYTGILTSRCLSNCIGVVLPMKCDKRKEKKF